MCNGDTLGFGVKRVYRGLVGGIAVAKDAIVLQKHLHLLRTHSSESKIDGDLPRDRFLLRRDSTALSNCSFKPSKYVRCWAVMICLPFSSFAQSLAASLGEIFSSAARAIVAMQEKTAKIDKRTFHVVLRPKKHRHDEDERRDS